MNCYEHTFIAKKDLPESQIKSLVDKYKDIADILIIGTSFKLDNNVENPVDFEKTKKIIEQIN